jgi:hypothetical protein
MKKTLVPVLIALFVVALLSNVSAGEKRPIIIQCAAGPASPAVVPETLVICPAEVATFTTTLGAGAGGCGDSVKVVGVAPINTFWLTTISPMKTVQFPAAGLYSYTATTYSGGLVQGTVSGWVNVRSSGCPTMTQWGVIIMVALIVGSAVFIMARRRRAMVPA